MAFTRKELRDEGLTEEQVEKIVRMHREVVDGIKETLDDTASKLKSATENETNLTKQIEELTAKAETAGTDAAAKVQAQFDAYKTKVEKEKTNAGKEVAIRAALKAAGVREDLHGLLMPQIDLEKIEVKDDGNLSDSAQIDALKTTYPAAFGSVNGSGIPNANPPTGGGSAPDYSKMSDAEYYAATYANNKK